MERDFNSLKVMRVKDCNSPDYDTLKILQFVHQNLFM